MTKEKKYTYIQQFHDPYRSELAYWCMIQLRDVLTERESSGQASYDRSYRL